jgi:benzaldehyde dehydrogenase (NAD)
LAPALIWRPTVPLLDDASWQRKIYSDGWVDGSGQPYPVVSPSTGEQLGTIGRATDADVHRAAVAGPRRRHEGI